MVSTLTTPPILNDSVSVPGSPLEFVKLDQAKLFTSQLASHAHYCGEAAGMRMAARIGEAVRTSITTPR